MNKSNHGRTITAKSIDNMRRMLDKMAKLVQERDKIDAALEAIGAELPGISALSVNKGPNEGQKVHKAKKSKKSKKGSVKERLMEICRDGATKAQIIRAMGVNPGTVDVYLYSKSYGANLLKRQVDDKGVTTWHTIQPS